MALRLQIGTILPSFYMRSGDLTQVLILILPTEPSFSSSPKSENIFMKQIVKSSMLNLRINFNMYLNMENIEVFRSWAVLTHTSNPSAQEVETGESLSSRLAQSTE